MANSSDKPTESFNDTETFTTDSAIENKNKEAFIAYEGTEYSFF